MSENVGNRYLVIVGAIIVQLCLGTIYAWSVFQDVLETGSGYGCKIVLGHGKSLR